MNVHQQTVRQPGGKISATGTDWNSNPTDSWVQGAEWGGFNIKGPIPKPMLYPSAGSGKCQACWRQLECTLTMTKAESAASHLIDGFINEGTWQRKRLGSSPPWLRHFALPSHPSASTVLIPLWSRDKISELTGWPETATDKMNIAFLAVMRQLGNFWGHTNV